MTAGVRTLNVPRCRLADSILVNRDGSSGQQYIADLAQQLLAQPAFSITAFASIAYFRASLAELQAEMPAVGAHGVVLSSDEEAGIYELTGSGWTWRAPIPAILTESLSAIEAREARDQVVEMLQLVADLATLAAIRDDVWASEEAVSTRVPSYFDGLSQLRANTSLWGEGQQLNTRTGYLYEVQPPASTEYHFADAAGNKLKYVPGRDFDLRALPLDTAAEYLAALKLGCASTRINVIAPAANLALVAGYSGTIPCAGKKRITVLDGVLTFAIPPTGATFAFKNPSPAAGDHSFFEADAMRFLRSNVTAPAAEVKNAIVSGFQTTTLHQWEASGSRGFHITISNSQFAKFDRCYAHDGYLGILGPDGTDGMHALGCQYVTFEECRASDLGDDAMSVGRDVQAAGNEYLYDWCEEARVIDCRAWNVKTASVKAYSRVRQLTVRGGTLEGGWAGRSGWCLDTPPSSTLELRSALSMWTLRAPCSGTLGDGWGLPAPATRLVQSTPIVRSIRCATCTASSRCTSEGANSRTARQSCATASMRKSSSPTPSCATLATNTRMMCCRSGSAGLTGSQRAAPATPAPRSGFPI